MTGIDKARAIYVEALLAERDEIDRLLAAVGFDPTLPRGPLPETREAFRKPQPLLDQGVPGDHTCPACGREGLAKQSGRGGWMTLHMAPCGLYCAGANLDRLDAQPEGVHSRKNCPQCKA